MKERPPHLPSAGVDPAHSDPDEVVNENMEGG
jgi:hypothetical protein